MNAIYALLLLVSAAAIILSPIAMISCRLRRPATKTLAAAGVTFACSVYMFTPDKPAASPPLVQEATAPATRRPERRGPEPQPEKARETPGSAGKARICLTDDEDLHLPAEAEVTLPPTTILEDEGPLKGQRDDPTTWASEIKEGSNWSGAIVTLDPAVLKMPSRCAEVSVKMYLDTTSTEATQKAFDGHVFRIKDVVDYPIPDRKPPVELGRLIDDIRVRAILTADATASQNARPAPSEEASAATCLAEATALAAYVGGGVGDAARLGVKLGGMAAHEANYGCATGSGSADLFLSWDGQAKPPAATRALIGEAGAFLTGAARGEIVAEATACVNEALKPASDEQATREFRGVKIECTAFTRDGGAGTVTIYRRFGSGAPRPTATPEQLASVARASQALREEGQRKAADSLAFARWWQDTSVPKEVKTFAMMASRMVALKDRCPSSNPHDHQIAGLAASAGIAASDMEPGGRYYDLLRAMIAGARADAQRDSVEAACEAAKRYD